MASKKLMSRKTATIIGVIFVVLVFSAVYYFFEAIYQKQYENPPELSIVLPNGEEVQMLKTKYFWNYKSETKEEELTKTPDVYDFPEEYVVLTGYDDTNWTDGGIKAKSNVKYRTTFVGISSTKIRKDTDNLLGTGNRHGDVSKLLSKGEYLIDSTNGIGEYVITVSVDWKNQGTVNYSIKLINFNEEKVKIAKQYMNISKENDKSKELVSKLYANQLLKNVELEGKNINLEYEYYISSEILRMNNVLLFACIPDLETITYTATHNKTMQYDEENFETSKVELDKIVYTKDEMNSYDMANVENLLKYMESL